MNSKSPLRRRVQTNSQNPHPPTAVSYLEQYKQAKAFKGIRRIEKYFALLIFV